MDEIDDDKLKLILERIEAKIEDTVSKKVEEVIKQVKGSVAEDEYLSPKEAAQVLRCSVRTIHYYKESGKLKFYMQGGQIRFKLEDLQAFIKKGRSKYPRII